MNDFGIFTAIAIHLITLFSLSLYLRSISRSHSLFGYFSQQISGFVLGIGIYLLAGFSLMYGGPSPWESDSGWITAISETNQNPEPASTYDSFVNAESSFFTDDYFNDLLWTDMLFQALFCATCVTIFTTCVAPYCHWLHTLIGQFLLSICAYPIFGRFVWGEGWLSDLGFTDFAGAALLGAIGSAAGLVTILLTKKRPDVPSSENGSSELLAVGSVSLIAGVHFFSIFLLNQFGSGSETYSALAYGEDLRGTLTDWAFSSIIAVGIIYLATYTIFGRIWHSIVFASFAGCQVASWASEQSENFTYETIVVGIAALSCVFICKLARANNLNPTFNYPSCILASSTIGTLSVPFTNAESRIQIQALGIATAIALSGLIFASLSLAFRCLKRSG